MSQVKNLRAMFESKGDSSPPDRGRSPAAVDNNDSPRPLSRVRTNFVAVEKNGRLGLRQEGGGDSSPTRQPSNDNDSNTNIGGTPKGTPTLSGRTTTMASTEDAGRSQRRLFVNEPIPESPRQSDAPSGTTDATTAPGALSDKPSTNPDKTMDEEQQTPKLLPGDAAVKSTASKPTRSTPASAANGKHTTLATSKLSVTKKTTDKPSATASKPTAKATVKSSTAPKSSAGTAKPPQTKLAVRAADKAVPKKDNGATTRAAGTATKPTAASASKKPTSIKTTEHHPSTGFVKPKPKSPTKPAALPPSLMAHTASSVSKGNAPRHSLPTKQAGTTHNLGVPGRSSSRASTSFATGTTQTVRRKGSTISHSRPSVGPPPKKAVHTDPEAAKRESNVDEGFLARIMRPTQASSSKTSEKAPVTPPRRGQQRPATAASHTSSRRESSVKRPPIAKSLAPAVPATDDQSAVPEDVEDISLDTANVETAEEVKELAEQVDPVEEPVETTLPEQQEPDTQLGSVEEDPAHEDMPEDTPEDTHEDTHEASHEIHPEEVAAHDLEPHTEQTTVETGVNEPMDGPTLVEEAAGESSHVEEAAEPKEEAPEPDMPEPPAGSETHETEEPAPVEEVAHETANVETAEEAIELAEEADLVEDSIDLEKAAAEQDEVKPEAEGNGKVLYKIVDTSGEAEEEEEEEEL